MVETKLRTRFFEEVKCMSNDNKNSGDAGNESHNENYNCNVSKPINADNAVPDNDVVIDVCVSEKLVDNDVKEIDNLKKGSYVSALNKNVLESDNKLFLVPTSVNEKGDDVVIFDEDLVNKGSQKWKFTNKKKSTKWVKVKYSWRPMVYSHCKVFGHNHCKCTLRPRTEEENEKINIGANKEGGKDGYTKVRNGKTQIEMYDWEAMERRMNVESDEEDVMENVDDAEHSNGGFGCNADMKGFSDLVNQLKVDGLCSFGFHFTWTKSLKNLNSSTLKNLDRILVNESFINQYCRAHGIFLPYLVSDHSASLMIFPNGLPKKHFGKQKHELLEIMPFKCDKLPMKYLGVPLLTKRLGDLYDARLADDAKVVDLIHNDRWNWPDELMEDIPDLQQIPLLVLDNDVKDKVL
nr:RNA-directed DNA polymerase, eukaryota, reverse transcriptase zinc-binding domain protein [Tanacetum cinerariifolium]